MIRKIVTLLSALLVISLSLYIVTQNRETLTVYLTPEYPITANAGVILIAVFCLGVLSATLVALVFGFKAYWRERSLKHKERQREIFFQQLITARSYLAAGEWGKAKDLWQQIVRRDPDNIIARIELSKCLEGSGDQREALRIVETVRAQFPDNIEALFRAAELNLGMNNKTAAIDNLALILYHSPSMRAATMARALSEDLGRIEDALEYHSRTEKLGTPASSEERAQVHARLECKRIIQECGQDQVRLLSELKNFLKRSPSCVEALSEVARLEEAQGNVEAAAQALVSAARVDSHFDRWSQALRLWASKGMPERALATARAARKETVGEQRIQAELNLIRVYLELNMLEEAKNAVAEFEKQFLSTGSDEVSREQTRHFLILKSLCLVLLDRSKDAADILRSLTKFSSVPGLMPLESAASYGINGEQPAARLSTP